MFAALYEEWQAHGVEVIAKVREEQQTFYLRVFSSLVNKDLPEPDPLEHMTDEELRQGIHAAYAKFLEEESKRTGGGKPS